MAGAPGGGGRAACGYGRTAASGCRRSRGLCNAPQALTPALGDPARPGNPERVDRGGGRLREKEREQIIVDRRTPLLMMIHFVLRCLKVLYLGGLFVHNVICSCKHKTLLYSKSILINGIR